MPSLTSIATRSTIVIFAAGLTTAAIRAPHPAEAGGLHTRYGSTVPMAMVRPGPTCWWTGSPASRSKSAWR